MKPVSTRSALLAGIALIVLTNAVALGGVAWNRAAPEGALTLSERELALPWRSKRNAENSGMALTLRWRVASDDSYREPYALHSPNGGRPAWLNGAKMQALGFSLDEVRSDVGQRRFTRQQARPAVIVLELDGAAYRAALAAARDNAVRHAAAAAVNPASKEFAGRAKAAREALSREEKINSRLFAVDVGPDAAQLRRQYPDTNRYLLLAGRVGPDLHRPTRDATPLPVGRIAGLDIGQFHVPRDLARAFDASAATLAEKPEERRFSAQIMVGRRLEPWIARIEALPAAVP